jgi:hypothetical protein
VILSSITDKIELVTSSVADIDYRTEYAIGDRTSSPMVVKDADTKSGTIAAIATTDVSGSPAAANDRWAITKLSYRNRHATTSNDLIVRYVKAGGTAREEIKVTLAAGEELICDKNGVWFKYDINGGVVMGATAATSSVAGLVELADAAEMEAATDTTKAVTPGLQHRHPGACKAWGMATVAANVPTLQASYGVSSITDSATGQIQWTWSTAFSSTNYAIQCNSEFTATTYAVANDRKVAVRNGTRATGSVSLDCIDSTATTNLKADPSSWFIMANGDQ